MDQKGLKMDQKGLKVVFAKKKHKKVFDGLPLWPLGLSWTSKNRMIRAKLKPLVKVVTICFEMKKTMDSVDGAARVTWSMSET